MNYADSSGSGATPSYNFTHDDKKRLKVDIEDIIRLAIEFSPKEAEEKILSICRQITELFQKLEDTLSTPNFHELEGLLRKFDSAISLISTVTDGKLTIFNTFRNIVSLLNGGKSNVSSLISSLTNFPPSTFSTFLREVGGLSNSVLGAVQFFTSLNPKTIVQNLIGGIVGATVGRLLPSTLSNILSAIFSGTPIGNLLQGISGRERGILGEIVNTIFGFPPSTSSVKPVDSLQGGFESPDGIQLSEKHIRGEK